jgi:predicted MFS family arabinose efflux permease
LIQIKDPPPMASPLLDGFTFSEAIRMPNDWLLVLAFPLSIAAVAGFSFHVPSILTERGYTLAQVAFVPSVVGATSLCGRLAAGALLDFLPFGPLGVIIFIGQAVGCLLFWTGWDGIFPFVAAGLTGFALGAEGDILPFVLRRVFGMRAYGKLYGFAFGIFQIGAAAGPIALGVGFDYYHAYSTMFLLLAGIALIAALLLALAATRSVELASAESRVLVSHHYPKVS